MVALNNAEFVFCNNGCVNHPHGHLVFDGGKLFSLEGDTPTTVKGFCFYSASGVYLTLSREKAAGKIEIDNEKIDVLTLIAAQFLPRESFIDYTASSFGLN